MIMSWPGIAMVSLKVNKDDVDGLEDMHREWNYSPPASVSGQSAAQALVT